MNKRQSLKECAKRITDLEHYNAKCKADITAYNKCIDAMIEHGTGAACKWCEEQEACQREVKGIKGCSEWWLMNVLPEMEDDSKGPIAIRGVCDES